METNREGLNLIFSLRTGTERQRFIILKKGRQAKSIKSINKLPEAPASTRLTRTKVTPVNFTERTMKLHIIFTAHHDNKSQD